MSSLIFPFLDLPGFNSSTMTFYSWYGTGKIFLHSHKLPSLQSILIVSYDPRPLLTPVFQLVKILLELYRNVKIPLLWWHFHTCAKTIFLWKGQLMKNLLKIVEPIADERSLWSKGIPGDLFVNLVTMTIDSNELLWWSCLVFIAVVELEATLCVKCLSYLEVWCYI